MWEDYRCATKEEINQFIIITISVRRCGGLRSRNRSRSPQPDIILLRMQSAEISRFEKDGKSFFRFFGSDRVDFGFRDKRFGGFAFQSSPAQLTQPPEPPTPRVERRQGALPAWDMQVMDARRGRRD